MRIHVLHDVHALAMDPAANKSDVIISGHSHRPLIEKRAGVLYLNPGSAGPRRFSLPVTVARLKVSVGPRRGELVDLLPRCRRCQRSMNESGRDEGVLQQSRNGLSVAVDHDLHATSNR